MEPLDCIEWRRVSRYCTENLASCPNSTHWEDENEDDEDEDESEAEEEDEEAPSRHVLSILHTAWEIFSSKSPLKATVSPLSIVIILQWSQPVGVSLPSAHS